MVDMGYDKLFAENYAKDSFRTNKKLVNINFQNGLGLIIMNMIIFTIIWFLFYTLTDL